MKNKNIILSVIAIIIIGIVSLVILTSEKAGIEVPNFERYDTNLTDMGLNPEDFIPSQKQPLSDYNWIYIKNFTTTDYITPSASDIMFERDWRISSTIDYDKTSIIDPNVYLFKNRDMYYLMATFEIPYNYNSNPEDIGFIDIGFSNNFKLSCYYSISYMNNDIEYRLQNETLTFDQTTTIPIKQNTNSAGYVSLPTLIYTYTCSIIPTEDNDLENDMYLGLDLDFYMLKNNHIEKVQVGFNEFLINNNYNTYTVIRKSVTYERR